MRLPCDPTAQAAARYADGGQRWPTRSGAVTVARVSGETIEAVERRVTPLELFFDLVFVFALTQVTSLLAHDLTWGGVVHLSLIHI